MVTIWDWLAMGLFCAITVLLLHRSIGPARRGDHMLAYLPPAAGCALVNWLGNAGHQVAAVIGAIAVATYIIAILRPGRPPNNPYG